LKISSNTLKNGKYEAGFDKSGFVHIMLFGR